MSETDTKTPLPGTLTSRGNRRDYVGVDAVSQQCAMNVLTLMTVFARDAVQQVLLESEQRFFAKDLSNALPHFFRGFGPVHRDSAAVDVDNPHASRKAGQLFGMCIEPGIQVFDT